MTIGINFLAPLSPSSSGLTRGPTVKEHTPFTSHGAFQLGVDLDDELPLEAHSAGSLRANRRLGASLLWVLGSSPRMTKRWNQSDLQLGWVLS
ncbi:hypothetical protein FHW17_000454 [Phyllobacterium sp. P30BS-XVII]|nr:hypothetical protein [Phyllobacterium sp. P30BS-XVII]